MGDITKGLEYLQVPAIVVAVIVGIFVVMQIIGELLEFKGKIVPEIMKVRKYFKRKKEEKCEATKTLKEVKSLLGDVNSHYSKDNITKRNDWMNWVNDRAEVYDSSIVEITSKLADVAQALIDNTKMTEEMFVQSSRDRIIDFATKVGDENTVVSKEEFNRIFKVHDRYEGFLTERGLTNGEVDIAYRIINDAYAYRLTHHSFLENIRGYDN